MNLFNFKEFFNELLSSNNLDRRNYVINYVKDFGEPQSLEDCVFHDFLTQFKVPYQDFELVVPKQLENKFNWEPLSQLIMASISSNYNFIHTNKGWELLFVINNPSNHTQANKLLSQLSKDEIIILHKAYLEEQIMLSVAFADREKYQDVIQSKKEDKIKEFKDKVKKIEKIYDVKKIQK